MRCKEKGVRVSQSPKIAICQFCSNKQIFFPLTSEFWISLKECAPLFALENLCGNIKLSSGVLIVVIKLVPCRPRGSYDG